MYKIFLFLHFHQSVCIITYSYTHNSQSVFHETILLPQMQKSHHRSIIAGGRRATVPDDSLRLNRVREKLLHVIAEESS